MVMLRERRRRAARTFFLWNRHAAIQLVALLRVAVFLAFMPIGFVPVMPFASMTQYVQAVPKTNDDPLDHRLARYQSVAGITGTRWSYLAAIDQFHRSLIVKNPDDPDAVSFRFPDVLWGGPGNPRAPEEDVRLINLFGGLGIDADGDQKASQDNPLDVLTALGRFLHRFGDDPENFREALAKLYDDEKKRRIILGFERLIAHYGRLDLDEKHFVLDRRYPYSYTNTFGATRGWGGRRIHEGADLFASYGTPVKSASYGYVEVIGWNNYGGWRIGIRDLNNVYYYYAHLAHFKKGLKEGDLVEPGEVIGFVGSSGYGPPGTQGKFPPHLHFGMYRYTGKYEWAFDPTPYLRRWEKNARARGE
ncbi:MAG: Cell wall endopeptidase, family M23/M37 [Candidatus Carbobacillus altaicus]|uniref:Cell wall endopeptidase, family M23/M37 n=1 Tax=Candidatus Carbonibacillus altaicus TaxID=2163959 RepID=A0A2R6Y4S1_9BACL|nr:MAG: Cell wall endopeptidase, family M23/M37 [Candidatus Carbobacillus altaicus]